MIMMVAVRGDNDGSGGITTVAMTILEPTQILLGSRKYPLRSGPVSDSNDPLLQLTTAAAYIMIIQLNYSTWCV